MKRPAFQFYPSDWRKDPALSACSLAARGLWIELMCIAHEASPYGYLSINGKPMTDTQLARMVGVAAGTLSKHIKELEEAGVFSRDDSGVIFSRRMVKDEHIRTVRANAGKVGGNPNLVRQDLAMDCLEGLGLLKQTDKQPAKQNSNQSPTPSSSSSSSSISNPDGLVVGSPSLPPCPHLRLLELFGQHLPDLPQPKPELWQGKNADAMRARWRWVLGAKTKAGKRYATNEAEAIDWFSRFFAYVSRSDFLTGRSGKWTNCDLGWLMKADNFAKVVQGNYENREVA